MLQHPALRSELLTHMSKEVGRQITVIVRARRMGQADHELAAFLASEMDWRLAASRRALALQSHSLLHTSDVEGGAVRFAAFETAASWRSPGTQAFRGGCPFLLGLAATHWRSSLRRSRLRQDRQAGRLMALLMLCKPPRREWTLPVGI